MTRPSLLLNFAATKRLDPRITFTRSSIATVIDQFGVLKSAAANTPRFDHDPLTGVCKGLLIEEQRTNSIRNGDATGAAVGSPGTLPTNWLIGGASGLTRTIVGTGTDNGVPYVDIRLQGTASGTFTSLSFDLSTVIAASNGQAWSQSAYIRLVAGSFSGTTFSHIIQQYNTGAFISNLQGPDISASVSSSGRLTRFSFSSTTNQAAITHVVPSMLLSYANGAVIDLTLRVGAAMLEAGAFPTSYIPTTSATVTRAADAVSMTGTNFSSWFRADEGTFLVQVERPAADTSVDVFLNANNGVDSSAARLRLYYNSATQIRYDAENSTVQQWLLSSTITAGEVARIAAGYKANDAAVCANAGTVSTDAASTIPPASQLVIGQGLTGHIAQLAYFPVRLTNAQLQGLTQ